jgi:hypothetical protein
VNRSRALRSVAWAGIVLASSGLLHADAVLDWNATALETTASAPFNPPLESRNLAIVHAAMFDAVNSIAGEFRPYAVEIDAPEGASPDAAAAAAAHSALAQLYPDQQAALDAAYATSLSRIPDGPAKTDGVAVGQAAAARILALRATDGTGAAIDAPYAPGAGPGDWIPTPPAFAPALDPGWGKVRPFCLEDGGSFRADPPPALTSAEYARDYREIADIGSATSRTRTRDQADLARFWVSTASQIWNPAARQVATGQGLTVSRNARALALLNLAGADAVIAAWDAKFAHNQWRPVTAIRAADTDGNPETTADPAWTPLLVTPPFPDYVAGHTAYAGAAAKVLEHVFGAHPGVVLKLTSAAAPGATRTYATFEEIADGVVEARVLGGIHWRTSSTQGKKMGAAVAAFAIDHCLEPRDERRDDAK